MYIGFLRKLNSHVNTGEKGGGEDAERRSDIDGSLRSQGRCAQSQRMRGTIALRNRTRTRSDDPGRDDR